MDHETIMYVNTDFHSAQVSDRVTCNIQLLKSLSGDFNNPHVPSKVLCTVYKAVPGDHHHNTKTGSEKRVYQVQPLMCNPR